MMIKHLNLILLLFIITLFACSDKEDANPLDSDNTPPAMEISFAGLPSVEEGSALLVSQQLEINIKAEDANGISKIEAFIDEQNVGAATKEPFAITVDLSGYSSSTASEGTNNYTLKVVATDNAGNTTSKEQLLSVDNEIPVISEVSLQEGMVLSGNTNILAFSVTDNEGVDLIKVYLNDNILTELIEGEPLEVNIDTTPLEDGQNTLKIEAIDIADNKASYAMNFISDNTGPEIKLESITDNMIIDELVSINPIVTDNYSEITSVEIRYNDEVLFSTDTNTDINYEFDSDAYDVGKGTFKITASDKLYNTTTIEIPVAIHRRLITINIPADRLNQAITAAVVFASRMDGSLIAWKEILREDRQIILNIDEEFDLETEFMLSFYLEDNGNMAGISTHQNLTRANPKVLNLSEPIRLNESTEFSTQIPTTNFLSKDALVGQSSNFSGLFRSLDNAVASYSTYLNTSNNYLDINSAIDNNNPNAFNSYYMYETSSFKYLVVNTPIDPNFALDKANLSNEDLTSHELVVSSQSPLTNTNSHLSIIAATSKEDDNNNKFHSIYHFNKSAILDMPMQYHLNSSFYSYRHAFRFGNYFTERKGAPIANYQIPNTSLDYTYSNNQINLSIQGTEHVVGRAQCIDFDNLTYDWYITFKSNNANTIIIPELPPSINHPVATAHSNGNIKVETVELLSYESILTYEDYIGKVIKNQTNILDATGWYQLIYKSNRPDFYKPCRDFVFQ